MSERSSAENEWEAEIELPAAKEQPSGVKPFGPGVLAIDIGQPKSVSRKESFCLSHHYRSTVNPGAVVDAPISPVLSLGEAPMEAFGNDGLQKTFGNAIKLRVIELLVDSLTP